MDIVPNHCSSEHPWFGAALASTKGSPERAKFLFRDGRGDGGSLPPNNWISVFGGPAWTRVTEPDGSPGQWYLHSFDPSQPDFDWRNPEVRDHFERILRFWFDRGVDGFRIDVASMLIKDAALPDLTAEQFATGNPYNSNQPEVHDVYRSWRRLADSYDRELVFVGEIWAPSADVVAEYVRPDELHQAFFFDLLAQPWQAAAFEHTARAGLASAIAAGGTFAWTLNNHDVHRAVSRYGVKAEADVASADPMAGSLRPRGAVDVALGTRRARAAAMFLLGLPGAVYLYQGEELALPEVMDLPDDARRDPIWERSGHREKGRDGCRVPLPWRHDAPTFGFSPRDATSWLPQPDWFGPYSVDVQQADDTSTLHLYRELLALRREVVRDQLTDVMWLDTGRADVVAYRRGRLTVVVVFGTDPYEPPSVWGEVRRCSDRGADGRGIPGSGAAWLVAAAR
jgi:alpha-glucosidase